MPILPFGPGFRRLNARASPDLTFDGVLIWSVPVTSLNREHITIGSRVNGQNHVFSGKKECIFDAER